MSNFRDFENVIVPDNLKDHLGEDSIMGDVANGFSGNNSGIILHTKKMEEYVGDIIKGQIILVGADSGVGKTTFTDDYFTWAAFKAKIQGYPVDVIYQSWEINKTAKRAKLASYILNHNNSEKRVNIKDIRGLGGRRLDPETISEINASSAMIDKFFNDCYFNEIPLSPSQFEEMLQNYAMAVGSLNFEGGEVSSFTPDDPKRMGLFIIDHIALCDTDNGKSLKESIDEISKICVKYRNLCNFTFVIVQQFNTDLQSANRNGDVSESSIIPQRLDFGDSKYTYRDADIVIGLIKPSDFELASFMRYDITIWKSNLIAAVLMKNRNGVGDKIMILRPDYVTGRFLEIPPPEDFRSNQNLYYDWLLNN